MELHLHKDKGAQILINVLQITLAFAFHIFSIMKRGEIRE
jgi:hypothetical protein